jgi:hypothetical protein
MASEILNTGLVGADGQPVVGLRTFLTNPATGAPFTGNANNELIQQLKDGITVTNTGAAGAGVTLTLPAGGAGKFTYLAYLQIILYATALMSGAAAPVLVTTTNLPNAPVFTFPTALAIGTTAEQKMEGLAPVKGSGLWRLNATYFIA